MKNSDGHEWTKRDEWTVCKKCGVIRRKDGKNKQCKGIIKITTRTTKAAMAQYIANLLVEMDVMRQDRDEGWKKYYEARKELAELKFPNMKKQIKVAEATLMEEIDALREDRDRGWKKYREAKEELAEFKCPRC